MAAVPRDHSLPRERRGMVLRAVFPGAQVRARSALVERLPRLRSSHVGRSIVVRSMKVALVAETWYRALGPLAGRASLGMSYLHGFQTLGHTTALIDLGGLSFKYRWLRGRIS